MEYEIKIVDVVGRQILDSRGNPTVEVTVTGYNEGTLEKGSATASVPSGASTGLSEAVELRDGNKKYYGGKSVAQAVKNINEDIKEKLYGMNLLEQTRIDEILCQLDGTKNKSRLGANAILGVSIACAKCAAKLLRIPLYRYLGGISGRILPCPMMNILNGGAHSKNNLDFQEFMIMPIGACCYKEALRMGTEVYHSLEGVLTEKGMSTAVGDEGGFAPNVASIEEVMDLLVEAVERAGYQIKKDIAFALDVAASEWKSGNRKGQYHMPKSGMNYSTEELIELYKKLVERYPIISIEDPLDEEDWEGWTKITAELGDKVQLVGDDLFVTNTSRIAMGIKQKCANAVLIKMNQIGTMTETIAAIEMAHKAGYKAIVSHRSGETEDITIADLAVATNCGQIKTGAPCRSERVAKYNQLLRIEEELFNPSGDVSPSSPD